MFELFCLPLVDGASAALAFFCYLLEAKKALRFEGERIKLKSV